MVKSGAYSTRPAPAISSEVASLYATYALILLTVPTFGVAAAIGLLRLWTSRPPEGALEYSHYVFQRRTLKIALLSIILGGVLIIVNVGVLVLFVMAVWSIVRGTLGLRSLLEGKVIRQPRRLFY